MWGKYINMGFKGMEPKRGDYIGRCRELEVRWGFRHGRRPAMKRPSRSSSSKETANWYVFTYLKVSLVSSKILPLS